MNSITKICSISECSSTYYAKGFCRIHWQRQYHHGNPLFVKPPHKTVIHGLSDTPEYRAYQMMKQRCYNDKYPQYTYWGGKGIEVCSRWLLDFRNFYDDMGPKPSPRYSLDRIDSNKDYEPENCRWATDSLQMLNTARPVGKLRPYNGVVCRGNRFSTLVMYQRKAFQIATFDTPEEASMAYWCVKEQFMALENV
jgi:hypothetical protein